MEEPTTSLSAWSPMLCRTANTRSEDPKIWKRNHSAHCIDVENACEIWYVEGVDPLPGLPVRTDDVTFIILFGFSPSKYYRLRQNTALMEYYDVDNILNMHCDLISNFSMKLFFGPFREWLWDVIRDLDDGRTIFGERGFRSLEVEGLLEHLKDSYTMDRIRSRPWYGQTGQ